MAMEANTYMYQADLYSAEGVMLALSGEDADSMIRSGEDAEDYLDRLAKARGIDRSDESSFDSDAFPKGPYPDGGGEADTPKHCAVTGEALENPLTADGYAYVREAVTPYVDAADFKDGEYVTASNAAKRARAADKETLAQWLDFYPEALDKANGGPVDFAAENAD